MRHIYRNIVLALIVLAPIGVAAQTVDLTALTAQIAALQAQIAAQLNAQQQSATTVTQDPDGNCVELSRTLSRGDSGEDVVDLQNFLISERLLEPGNASGFFGTLTETAVKQWQNTHGIEPLGITGPRTRAAMASCTGGQSQSTETPLVSNQCPTVAKPEVCENAVVVQQNGCTVGWQCSVANLPAQTFTAAPKTGATPLVVTFSGVVTSANAGFCEGNFCAATLVFGDGSTGAIPLPNAKGTALSYKITHTYTKGGPFIANLYQGAAGSGVPIVGNGISINPIAPVVVVPSGPAITVTPNSGTAPLGVVVTVSNVGTGANLAIEFGDGSFSSVQPMGTGLGATHTYINGGSYTIKLRRVNNSGDTCVSASCQVLATTGLSVGSAQVASAALAPTPNTGAAPLRVSVFSNGGSTAYTGGVILDFGDNSTELLCGPGVICNQKTSSHTYAAAGEYTLQLLGLNAGGTTILKSAKVSVLSPQATAFKAEPSTGPVPLVVTFTAHGGNQPYVNGAILKYGDDTSEVFCNPNELCGLKTKTHTYTDGAQYGAQLIALGSGSASTTIGSAVVTATGGPSRIKVTGPTGVAKKGDSVPLTWKVFGTKPTTGSLSFDLYTLAGARIGTILTITNFQSGTATWKIPSTADKNCTATQPNGLCGVNIKPGTYKIQGYAAGTSLSTDVTSEAQIEIKDELIAPSQFTLSVAPSAAEKGKPMSIKYRISNPPFDGAVALWLVKPSGEAVGVIAGKLEADAELTTYPWTAGATQPCVAAIVNPLVNCMMMLGTSTLPVGPYHILAKVYAPFSADFTKADTIVHATATSTSFLIKEPDSGLSCIVITNNLAPGDTDDTKGGDVSRLQQFLSQDSDIYPEGTVTGFYGNATRRAVERFQAAHSIVSSGSPETNGYGAVGPSTRAAIAANCTTNGGDYLFRATPKSGRAPLRVTFSADAAKIAAMPANLFYVDFGDGTTGTFTLSGGTATVAHTYPANGTYIAKLMTPTSFVCPDTAVCNRPADRVAGTVSVSVTNVTTPPPQTCAAITHPLSAEDKDASTGGDVSRLQQFLAADPVLYPEGLVTGFYGPATTRAVGRYQVSKGLPNTGTVGPQTLAIIRCTPDTGNEVFSATPLTGATPLLVRFATNKTVTTGSYRVKFGDGATTWLSASSTTHTYSTAGAYTAELIESVGNCFGLTGASLEICEIGNAVVIGTKTINVSSPATMSVVISPTTLARGTALGINWVTTNAPAGAKVRLEAYRDGAIEATGSSNSDQGLAADSSQLAVNGSYTWTIPITESIIADAGHGGYVMAPGSYHITAKLYTGDTCWGYCAAAPVRTINAAGKSSSFTVTAAGTGGGGGGGAFTGQIACSNPTATGMPIMARITLADGSTRDFEFTSSGTQYADFAAKPTAVAGFYAGIGYYSSGMGERWTAGVSTNTGQTGGSISMSFRQNTGYVFAGTEGSCTVTWH